LDLLNDELCSSDYGSLVLWAEKREHPKSNWFACSDSKLNHTTVDFVMPDVQVLAPNHQRQRQMLSALMQLHGVACKEKRCCVALGMLFFLPNV
jgi:hypothetical protein